MNRVTFYLKDFPKFHRMCRAMWAAYNCSYEQTFVDNGFTTGTRLKPHNKLQWSMDDVEFTLFVLKWSGEIND